MLDHSTVTKMDQKWSENGQKGKKEVLGHFLEFGLWDRLDIAYCDFTLYSLTFDKITRSCWITRKSEKCSFGWFKGKASKQARKQNKQKLQSFQNSRICGLLFESFEHQEGQTWCWFFQDFKSFQWFSSFDFLKWSKSFHDVTVLHFSGGQPWEWMLVR